MNQSLLISLTLAGTMLLVNSSHAATYKWTDAQGNVHYTQHPPAEGSYERLKVDKSRPSSSEPDTDTSTTPSTTAPSGSTKNNPVIKEEIAKNEEIRTKNCEAAKKNLEILTVYKRYKDKDGNVVRMDDNERAQKIDEAKQQINEFCD